MRITRSLVVAAAVAVACLSSMGCASADTKKKHSFTAADYKLDFLEPGKAAERLKPMIGEKITMILDFIESKLPPALATLGPAAPIAKVAVNKSKPLITEVVSAALMQAFEERKDELEPVMQRYNVFADPELQFELLDEPENEAKPTIQRANETLKRGYRVTRSVRVARKLLQVARKDAEALKTAPSESSLAGIGVAGISITQIALESIVDVQTMLPETENLGKECANQVTQNPLLAVDYGAAATQLTGAQAELTAIPADASGLLGDAADILGLLGNAKPSEAPAE